MMERTDSHCRVLHRALSARARLYTEMVTAEAVIFGDRARLLSFSPREHPLALQLGGAEPSRLAEAARIVAGFGYDEINLNAGCPSSRVQSGRFGACLMREPKLIGACLEAMRRAAGIEVTLKCRLGVDEQEPSRALRETIARAADAGVGTIIVHARKAWLDGLSPKENREVPPLDHALVYAIKRENPQLSIVLNGGIETLGEASEHLAHVDGVMLGREVRPPEWEAQLRQIFAYGLVVVSVYLAYKNHPTLSPHAAPLVSFKTECVHALRARRALGMQ